MNDLIDAAGPVRRGEELDAARIDGFLRARIDGLAGTPAIGQFPGGASNLTYLVRYSDRDLVLRRPPFGARAGAAHDMLREARVMAALKPYYGHVPRVLALGDDESVMGCPFYVMERVSGIIPRHDLPAGLGLDAPSTRQLCMNVLECLAALHAIEPEGTPLAAIGRGEGYVTRQFEGWRERWQRARTDDVGDFTAVIAWLDHERPARDVALRVIHNDFRFDNVVLDAADPLRVIAVLDWEMATIGDPLMDLGNTLAYWVEAGDDEAFRRTRRQPTDAPGMPTRAEVVAWYGARTGLDVSRFDFYLVFGLFRLAVIVQQIYRRWRDGHAANPLFGTFGGVTRTLERRCLQLIDGSLR